VGEKNTVILPRNEFESNYRPSYTDYLKKPWMEYAMQDGGFHLDQQKLLS
jgi:hypothetical protein